MGIAFQAEPQLGAGSRLMTETRVANVSFAFRVYWTLVGPFSALIRRRWLRAVAITVADDEKAPRNRHA